MPKKLSKTMQSCLEKLGKHEVFIRESGGFWTAKNTTRAIWAGKEQTYPDWYFNWNTIEALIKRGYVRVAKTKQGHSGEYAVEVQILPFKK